MFDIDANAAVGRSISDFIPIRWKESFIADVGRLQTAEQSVVEYQDAVGLRSDSTEFPYEGTLSRSVTEIDQFNTLKIRDLSEAKASEAKRREYVAILQQLRDAVLVCDLETKSCRGMKTRYPCSESLNHRRSGRMSKSCYSTIVLETGCEADRRSWKQASIPLS